MRKAIARFLNGLRGVEFGGAARTLAQLLAAAERGRPDLLVIDVDLVAIDGFSGLRRLRAAYNTRTVLLTIYDGEELRAMAAKGIADACICKSRLHDQLGGEIARLFPTGAGTEPAPRVRNRPSTHNATRGSRADEGVRPT